MEDKETEISDKFKDVIYLNGYYYTVHLTVDKSTGRIINEKTWIE